MLNVLVIISAKVVFVIKQNTFVQKATDQNTLKNLVIGQNLYAAMKLILGLKHIIDAMESIAAAIINVHLGYTAIKTFYNVKKV